MIIKTGTSKSYKGSAIYNEHGSNQEMKQRQAEAKEFDEPYVPKGELYHSQYCAGDSSEIAAQMLELKKELNPKLEKCAYTPSMNFAPEDRNKLSEVQKLEIVRGFSEYMGFAQNQYSVHRHNDKDHEHFHFLVNRVGLDGKTWNDSFCKRRESEFARNTEVNYDLRQVMMKSKERLKMTGKDEEFVNQNPYMPAFKKDIDFFIKESNTFKEFKEKMEDRGYKLQTGFGLGYTNAQGIKFGGKELGKEYQKTSVDARIETGRQGREQEQQEKIQQQARLALQLQRSLEAQERERKEALKKEKTLEVERLLKLEEQKKQEVEKQQIKPNKNRGMRM